MWPVTAATWVGQQRQRVAAAADEEAQVWLEQLCDQQAQSLTHHASAVARLPCKPHLQAPASSGSARVRKFVRCYRGIIESF